MSSFSSFSSSPPPTTYLTNIGFGYSIAIALGFLFLLSTLILSSYLCLRTIRNRNRNRNLNDTNNDNNNSNNNNNTNSDGVVLPRIIFVAEDDEENQNDDVVTGLEQNVINSYPRFEYNKEVVHGVGHDATCSICLCEYKDSEMLRMMPECRHYFHLCCLDSWLKLNGSCPVCRNSPLPTPVSTPLQEVVPLAQYAADRRGRRIQEEMDRLKERANDPSSPSVYKQAAFLADILGLLESVNAPHQQSSSFTIHPLLKERKQSDEPADYFLREEIRKYVRIKPNRLGKQNFMGANATFTSIGHACFSMREELEEYMDYDIGEICNDDWKLAQKLMVHGCDPLPRRRCFSRSPKLYNQPFPINESMWKLPDDRNVRWSQYRCKNFSCLASTTARKGFFKCADCFNLTDHEMPRWVKLDADPHQSADFLISDVLGIKPGEIRIGLDFSVGTGTFAARMSEFNVTIVSASINLGAPFSEMIALRGLVPLYLTINQRLPFFDNTLDLIHTTRFLDGWIDFVLLDFVLYDWDRVLRPGGLLWVDSFFCLKEDLYDYLQAFKMLRYKRHKWVVVPKLDKHDQEVFFSAVLEKPPRPFR
ncbi:putative transcription factor C2H2 family [Lupinus albus]|uniref:Putative transcription factor C2H2 family n=1 Tax=Lupinus albus TaxID=3870 RepID=A0A6A4PV12_LUPAL|nr:putative transcription factor C2H2 family [Lupinus albus]